MTAYYNEIDPYAAQWLRNLIAAGHIAPGDVDERSILEVKPDDLRGYTQCHFFAGIGGWSHALRLAGWPDDRPVWTGSCPCQPFSAAGKQRGSNDERHLWPAFFDLIRECGPGSVFGEQVAGAAGLAWLDHVCADLEGAGYAAAAADLCAAGAGAPHIRQRLYWVAHAAVCADQRSITRSDQRAVQAADGRHHGGLADASSARAGRDARATLGTEASMRSARSADGVERGDASISGGAVRGLADADEGQRGWIAGGQGCELDRPQAGRHESHGQLESGCAGDLADPAPGGQRIDGSAPGQTGHAAQCDTACGLADATDAGSQGRDRPRNLELHRTTGTVRPTAETSVFDAWADLEWIECSDGKARPTQPGLFPLAHGIPNRVGRLRAYGNAIVPQVAAVFARAALGE